MSIPLTSFCLFRLLISESHWSCVCQKNPTLLVHLINMGFVDFFFLLTNRCFVSFYPAELWLLWKSCWTLCSCRLHIFFLSLGFHPKPILFNLPAAALEVTSVQIYTLYHGWHVVCVSVYLKSSSNCLLPIICDFFLCSITGWWVLCLFMQPDSYPLFFVPCTTCSYALEEAGTYMTGKVYISELSGNQNNEFSCFLTFTYHQNMLQ